MEQVVQARGTREAEMAKLLDPDDLARTARLLLDTRGKLRRAEIEVL